MEEWKEYKLGELSEIQTGPFGSQLHQRDYVDDGTPCIMPTNIGNNLDILSEGIAKVKDEDVKRLQKHCVKLGDIIYSRRGDIEKCAFITQQEEGWLCGTGCLRIRINPGNTIPLFIAYQLSTKECKRWIVGNAVGTTMLNLNTGILKELPLSIPNIQEQHKIVSILSSLDDKIELNRKINANLEAQAQALFKSWFVDFEPFKDQPFVESELGMIPEGWRVTEFKEFIHPMTEKVSVGCLPEYSVTNNGIIPRDAKFNKKLSKETSKNKVLRKNNLVFGMSREILNWGIMEDEIGGVSSAYNIFEINEGIISPVFLRLYMTAKISDFNSIIGTAAREGQSLDKGALMQKTIYIPPKEIVEKFFEIYFSITALKKEAEQESRRLASLRDVLLSRLMSGELKVNEVI